MRAMIYARTAVNDIEKLNWQIEACKGFALGADWTVIEVFTDLGQSGMERNRPGLQALFRATLNGECDALLTTDMARLSRNLADQVEIQKVLQCDGVKLVTLFTPEGKISHDTSTGDGLIH
ncbi:MAG: recombinase family protein [Steroidobacteraceae bacterium]